MNLEDHERIDTLIVAKDAEIERWKDQTMDARQLAIDEATTIRGLRAEIAALRDALEAVEFINGRGARIVLTVNMTYGQWRDLRRAALEMSGGVKVEGVKYWE